MSKFCVFWILQRENWHIEVYEFVDPVLLLQDKPYNIIIFNDVGSLIALMGFNELSAK